MTSQLPGREWARNATPASARPSTPQDASFWSSGASFPFNVHSRSPTNTTLAEKSMEPVAKRQRLDIRGHSRVTSLNTAAHVSNTSIGAAVSPRGSGQAANGKPTPTSAKSLKDTPLEPSSVDGAQSHHHLPLPPRPQQGTTKKPSATKSTPTAFSKTPVQVKPYTPETPALAPRFDGENPADFRPWKSHHPEDVISESTTKNGFYDRLSTTQSESTTARPSIWSSLKHKSGLQVLSSLFGSVLAHRQLHGTVTATSTFKPPPRVTLTDSKREIWLRDLANPAIPLRRLSRTIPHGIRGKSLLDHCLSKDIPIPRAVWLVKCVGANEIRAFKRKGTVGAFAIGGEAKWIKEWTANVEQFAESTLKLCGYQEWASKIKYCLRLTAHLFVHRLIDEEHYLDWITQGVRNAERDVLPIWLLIVRMHHDELRKQRRQGRLLVASLLKHLHQCNNRPDRTLNVPVLDSLKSVLRETALKSPSNFVSSSGWKQDLAALKSCFDDEDLILQQAFDSIVKRNEVLASALTIPTDSEGYRLRKAYIKMLDQIGPHSDLGGLLMQCTEMTQEHRIWVHTTLEWGSSSYRQGEATIYKATRVLSHFSRIGVDLNSHVLDFLTATLTMPGLDKRKLFRILAELFRSQHLAVGKYLQWAIARGVSTQAKIPDHLGRCETRLLFEIPLLGLPEHILSLRKVLIESLGASLEGEARCIANMKEHITMGLEGIETLAQGSLSTMITPALSQTVRSDLAHWVRTTVLSRWAICDQGDQADVSKAAATQMFRGHGEQQELKPVIRILEMLGDYSILADVLCASTWCRDEGLLLDAAECVNLHFETFAAIGALTDLFKHLIQQYRERQHQHALNSYLLESLFDLGSRIPLLTEEVESLRQSLLHSKQKTSVMACSPVSDHVAEALQSIEENFADELEQALSIGTTMDLPTMKQLLDLIMDRFELSWVSPKPETDDFAAMLEKLKQFDHDTFSTLFIDRIQRVLLAPGRPKLSSFVPSFISARCTTLDDVLGLIVEPLGSHQCSLEVSELVMEAFELLTLTNCEYDPALNGVRFLHRYFDEQHKAIAGAAAPVVAIVSAALNNSKVFTKEMTQRFRLLVSVLALHQPSLLANLSLEQKNSSSFLAQATQPAADAVTGNMPEESSPELGDLVRATDDFNGPIVSSSLNAILSASEDGATGQLLDTLVSHDARCSEHAGRPWTRILSGIDERHSSALQEQAEFRLLSRLPDGLRMPGDIENDSQISVLLSIINTTSARLNVKVASTLVKQTLDSFALIFSVSQSQESRLPSSKLERTISILLSVLTLHLSSVEEPSFSQSLIHDAILILSIIMTNSPVSMSPDISQQLNDLLIVLSDSLHDETRTRLLKARQTLPTPADPRFDYIFGKIEPKDDTWLHLLSEPSPQTSLSAPGRTSDGAKRAAQPFPIRQWEMMQDTTPVMGGNDTSLSMTLFGARKAIY